MVHLRHEALTTPSDDPVREYCRLRGYSSRVILGGLDYLLDKWERVVYSFAGEYAQSLDSYRNDMDGRRILDEILPLASAAKRDAVAGRLAAADTLFRDTVIPAPLCIWGVNSGYDPHRHWWYFTRPPRLGYGWTHFGYGQDRLLGPPSTARSAGRPAT